MRDFSPGLRLPHRFGRYLLQEKVGGGGMATVYRATFSVEGGFEKEVALKVIRGELSEDPQFIRMFLDEARLSGSLSHPNVVQTFDFGQVDGIYYLAMELVRGRTLAAILEALRDNRLRLGTAASLFVAKELARALDYAHRAVGADGRSLGIVHRDVSPQNVLVSREGHVKLADFGIAKAALRSQVTQPGRVRGKCSYMAPEQAKGLEVDARADVFALGAVLWECLVGRRLFDGPTDAAVLLEVIEKDIPPPSRFVQGLPPEVNRTVLRLLERDPQSRPSSGTAYRELADLAFRLARSPEDLDLHHLQQRLASATAAVSQPIELSTWKSSGEGDYPWTVDPDAETIVSDEEIFLQPTRPLTPDVPTQIHSSAERETQTLAGEGTRLPTTEGEATRWGRAMVPVAIASALGAVLGIAAMTVWNPWAGPRGSIHGEKFETSRPENENIETVVRAFEPAPERVPDPEVKPESVPQPEAKMEPEPVAEFAIEQPSSAAETPPPSRPEDVIAHASELDVSNSEPPTARPQRTPAAKPSPTVEEKSPPTSGKRKPPPSRSQPLAAASPAKPAPPPVTGTLVLSTRLPEVRVRIDGRQRETLSPLSPRSLELPTGLRELHFSHPEIECSVSVRLDSEERLALLLDAQGVHALRGLERERLPCR